ncbi:hypothetical protein TNIN_275391, partial [Trichonephila inaurata madagascariensis]
MREDELPPFFLHSSRPRPLIGKGGDISPSFSGSILKLSHPPVPETAIFTTHVGVVWKFGVFSENSSCATVYDLYHFYCLRKSLFDFEASGITKSVPSQTIEKFCLQLKLSIINGIAVIVFTLLYSVSVLTCCIIIRFLKQRLTSIFRVPKKQGHKEKKTFWKSLLSSARMQLLE